MALKPVNEHTPKNHIKYGTEEERNKHHFMGMKAQDHTENKKHLQCY